MRLRGSSLYGSGAGGRLALGSELESVRDGVGQPGHRHEHPTACYAGATDRPTQQLFGEARAFRVEETQLAGSIFCFVLGLLCTGALSAQVPEGWTLLSAFNSPHGLQLVSPRSTSTPPIPLTNVR